MFLAEVDWDALAAEVKAANEFATSDCEGVVCD